MSDSAPDKPEKGARPNNREAETEDYKPASESGQAPRPSSEPDQSQGSARNPHTATDPASGEPTDGDQP